MFYAQKVGIFLLIFVLIVSGCKSSKPKKKVTAEDYAKREESEYEKYLEQVAIDLVQKLALQKDASVGFDKAKIEGNFCLRLTEVLKLKTEQALIDAGVKIIKEDQLEKSLEIQKREMSDLYDPEKSAKVGELIGIEFLIAAKLFEVGNFCNISLEATDIKRGAVVAKAERSISRPKPKRKRKKKKRK